MRYNEETSVSGFYAEGRHIFEENKNELDFFSRDLDLDVDAYQGLLDQKILKFYSLRDENNRVMGYSVFTLYMHTHYKGMLMAEQDSLFVTRNYRARALPFISWCDKQLKESGVSAVLRQVPKIKNWSLLLNRLNYEEIETVYVRRLKE